MKASGQIHQGNSRLVAGRDHQAVSSFVKTGFEDYEVDSFLIRIFRRKSENVPAKQRCLVEIDEPLLWVHTSPFYSNPLVAAHPWCGHANTFSQDADCMLLLTKVWPEWKHLREAAAPSVHQARAVGAPLPHPMAHSPIRPLPREKSSSRSAQI